LLDIAVLRLVRVAIGPVLLGQLSKGSVRRLTEEEKQALDCVFRGTRNGSGETVPRWI
jgi:16S rRNA U516 pseudouridylate synthase RsuA-like enzyme